MAFPSDIFIRRPVLAIVVSALVVVVGIAALQRLPVREYPDVDSAVVTVSTNYTGAAPEVIDTEITEIVEGAVSSVDGVKRIESSSREGSARTVIEFDAARDIDEAAADVREAVSRIQRQLPDDADQPQVVKADDDSDPVVRLSLTSARLSAPELTDIAERTVVERLSTVTGVARVNIYGERRYAIRVWLDRRAMAARGLTIGDIEAALRRSNVELPSGMLEAPTRQLSIRTNSRLRTVEDFGDVVLREVGGYPIRLSDVATVELGVEDDSTIVRSEGRNAVGMGILRQSTANTLAVSSGVRAVVEEIRSSLPGDVGLEVTSDDATFIRASIREVVEALFIAMGLVVLVIFLFLGSLRATLIPAITIPVSVIGTFALMAAMGFSINVLTLLALLLAIGLVVDDAIVVLENNQRRIDEGEPPLAATFLGTRQVTFAVIATSVTLIAVFVPISLIPGDIGRLFREFAMTLACAVMISTVVALTLSPMLCSRLLTPVAANAGLLVRIVDRLFRRLSAGYRAALSRALAMPVVVLACGLVVAGSAVQLFAMLPQELVPTEDRGGVFIRSTAPQGSTVAFTAKAVEEVEALAAPLLADGTADRMVSIIGFRNQPHSAITIVNLVDWSARTRSQQEIVDELRRGLGQLAGVSAFAINRSGLVRGSGQQSIDFIIGGPDYEVVDEWVERIRERAEANPGLGDLETDYEETRPQLNLNIDRRRADDLGVAAEDIASTVQTMLASREVTGFIDRGREYEVRLQAEDADRRDPTDLENLFVRADNDVLVPLTALVDVEIGAAPPDLRRFNRLRSIEIKASLVDGYDMGSAIAWFEQVAAEELPPGARASFDGVAAKFQETSGGLYVTFALALLVVFLVLAAQFESFVHPAIIMLSVPLAVTGALASLAFTGLSINIYSQIGLVLLIGLMAKNGILIVEFANQLRDEGLTVREAILEASVLRLRPILMTVISTILGAVPLVIASGAGSESRTAIGTVVVGGLAIATLLTLFLTPVLYDLLARFTDARSSVERRLQGQLAQLDRRPAE